MSVKTLSKSFVCLLVLIGLVSCDNSKSLVSIGSSVDDVYQVFDKKNVISFDNQLLISGKDKNYIAVVDDSNKVKDIKDYPLVEFDKEKIINLNQYTSLEKIVKTVGMPTFLGLEEPLSLDYTKDDFCVYRLFLTQHDNLYVSTDVQTLSKANGDIWLDTSKKNLPDEKDTKKIVKDMSFYDVVSYLGKPQREVGSGIWIYEFDLSSGKVFSVSFSPDKEKENEFYKEHPDAPQQIRFLRVTSFELKD